MSFLFHLAFRVRHHWKISKKTAKSHELYDIIDRVHSAELCHSGLCKTIARAIPIVLSFLIQRYYIISHTETRNLHYLLTSFESLVLMSPEKCLLQK